MGWRIALGLVLGLALLAAVARGVDLSQIGAGLAGANPIWAVLALLSVLLTTAAKIGRWRGLFPRERRPALPLLGEALLVGQMANALLPARLGDLARAYLVGTGDGPGRATALGTVGAEKAFDVLFLLAAAVLSAAVGVLPPWVDWALFSVASAGLLAIVAALAWSAEPALAWASGWVGRRLGKPGERVLGAAHRVFRGLRSLRDVRAVLPACAWSAAIWTLAAGTNYLLFLAFGLPLSLGEALFLLVVLHVGVAPPSSPGKLGVFHALVVVSLEFLGVGRPAALVYGAVLHAIVYGPQIALGALSLALVRWRDGGSAS
jgi:uncharacterized protein (TIRG00374 family)